MDRGGDGTMETPSMPMNCALKVGGTIQLHQLRRGSVQSIAYIYILYSSH